MSDQERRSYTRIAFDNWVELSQGDHNWRAPLLDLSLRGLLIKQPEEWDIDHDQPIKVSISLDNDTVIQMTVVWRHDANGQTGFECDHIDIDSISILRRFVEFNLGDPAMLERELATLGS